MVACFWPFEFHPHNDVVYVPGEHALRFYGFGTAYSFDSFPSLPALSRSNELTVEMALRPANISNTSLPIILSFAPEVGQPTLVIGAWKNSLIIRLGQPENPKMGKYHDIGVGDVFATGQTVHLVISFGPNGTTIFVDGHPKQSFSDASFDTSTTQLGRLLLGNSLTGRSFWKGDILALALYNRPLTPFEIAQDSSVLSLPDRKESDDGLIARYRFERTQGNLIPNTLSTKFGIVIPTYFVPQRQTVLAPPRGYPLLTFSSIKDLFLNVIGFMPFGILAMMSLSSSTAISPRKQSTLAVSAGFLLSLFIELIQVFIPTRNSTLSDLATNTLGSALGAIVFFILSTWKFKMPERPCPVVD